MSDGVMDKDHLYGKFQAGSDWQQNLMKTATHKALDIPEDVNINAPKSTTINHNYPPGATPSADGKAVLPTSKTFSPTNMILATLAALGVGAGGAAIATRPATAITPSLVQDVEQIQQPDGSWKEAWRGPARPKVGTDKIQTP